MFSSEIFCSASVRSIVRIFYSTTNNIKSSKDIMVSNIMEISNQEPHKKSKFFITFKNAKKAYCF